MSGIYIKVNLRALKHIITSMTRKDGSQVKGIFIPFEPNNLKEYEKTIPLEMNAFEIKNKTNDSKDTHLIKQSIPKEIYETMNDQQKMDMPVLGNLVDWKLLTEQPNSVHTEYQNEQPMAPNDQDDLPF